MIPRTNRFQGFKSLKYVYQKGSTVRGPLFSVKASLNPRRSSFRVAIVVSRKVHKSAVARNRVRRRLYEVVREFSPDIAGPYDIVFTVYSESVLEETPKSLRDQVRKQLTNAGVLASRVSK